MNSTIDQIFAINSIQQNGNLFYEIRFVNLGKIKTHSVGLAYTLLKSMGRDLRGLTLDVLAQDEELLQECENFLFSMVGTSEKPISIMLDWNDDEFEAKDKEGNNILIPVKNISKFIKAGINTSAGGLLAGVVSKQKAKTELLENKLQEIAALASVENLKAFKKANLPLMSNESIFNAIEAKEEQLKA